MAPLTMTVRRLPRLLVGLTIFGVGVAMIVAGDYGLPGWDVFHQGLAEQLPISIGVATIGVGVVILAVLVALREPIGVGTVCNVVVIGLAVDASLWALDDPTNSVLRFMLTLTGPFVIALGSGLYLGVRLGPGPRDGLMTAMGQRGVTLWKARFAIEATAMVAGIVLGGTVGWGTVWFLVAIGPSVQWAYGRFSVPAEAGERFGHLRAAEASVQ